MKKLFSLLTFLLIAAGAWADYYTPSSAYTQGDAVIYATVVTNEAGVPALAYEVGAFVDDMCIGNANAQLAQNGAAIFTIRARGNEDLVGKTIEFRAYNQNSGMEYKLTPSQTITFQLTGTYGYPSQLVTLTLTAPTSITLDNFEIEVGETVNLLDYVHITPAGATLPLNGEWYIEGDNHAVIFEDNLNLTGVEPGMISYMYEVGDERYYGVCTIVLRATAINILTDEFEVQRDDGESLSMFMRNLYPESGGNYQLVPAGATDKVYWELKDDGVIVQEEENVWYPRKAGTTQIRPYFINKSGTKVYPANNKWITINVWVQLDNIILDFPGSVVYANVGDDIYQRLVDHLSFSPEDATVSGYTFSTNAPDLLTISGTSALVKAAGEGTIRVTAEGLTTEVAFTFFDPLKEVTFKKGINDILVNNYELAGNKTDAPRADAEPSETDVCNFVKLPDSDIHVYGRQLNILGKKMVMMPQVFVPYVKGGNISCPQAPDFVVSVCVTFKCDEGCMQFSKTFIPQIKLISHGELFDWHARLKQYSEKCAQGQPVGTLANNSSVKVYDKHSDFFLERTIRILAGAR